MWTAPQIALCLSSARTATGQGAISMARLSVRRTSCSSHLTSLLQNAPADPKKEAAHVAGLRYVHDTTPGIHCKRAGRAFTYFDLSGERISDRREIERINNLGIPPSWTAVWTCLNPSSQLRATGSDAKGRTRYRYHPRWASVRAETKYQRSISFGEALPHIRARVAHDLAPPSLPRE